MKFVLTLLAIVMIAFVYAEHCSNNNHNECHDVHPLTSCHNHTHVFCINGWCECSYNPPGTGGSCLTRADCTSSSCINQHDFHCVDGTCRCTMPHPDGPGQGGLGQGGPAQGR